MERRADAEVFPSLHKPQRRRERGDKGRKLLILTALQLLKGKLDLRALGFGGKGNIARFLHGEVFFLLTAKVHHQSFGRDVKDLADKLSAGPGDAQRHLVAV